MVEQRGALFRREGREHLHHHVRQLLLGVGGGEVLDGLWDGPEQAVVRLILSRALAPVAGHLLGRLLAHGALLREVAGEVQRHHVRVHPPLALDLAAFVLHKLARDAGRGGPEVQPVEVRLRHLDAHGLARALHAARRVHRVSEEAVPRALAAHDAGVHGPSVQADADLEVLGLHHLHLLAVVLEAFHALDHGARHTEQPLAVVRRPVVARGCHVGVADGLHFVHAVHVHHVVKGGEHVVQQEHHLHGGQGGGQHREPHNIRKQDARLRVVVRNALGAGVQAVDDGSREDLLQQGHGHGALHLALACVLELQLRLHAREQLPLVEGLLDVVRGPALQALDNVRFSGLGADHDHGDADGGEELLDLGVHLVAGHAWHHHIQQNQVWQSLRVLQERNRLRPVHGDVHGEAARLEEALQHHVVDGVVVDAEDHVLLVHVPPVGHARRLAHLQQAAHHEGALPGGQGAAVLAGGGDERLAQVKALVVRGSGGGRMRAPVHAPRLLVRRGLREGEGEGGSLAHGAGHPDGAVVRLHQRLHQAQAQPRAPELARGDVVLLHKLLENGLVRRLWDARARVCHAHLDHVLRPVAQGLRAHGDAPSLGELDGVSKQVVQHLQQAVFVPEGVGQVLRDVDVQRHVLLGESGDQLHRLLHQRLDGHLELHHHQLVVHLHAGRVQDVVDEAQQPAPAHLHRA
mmetsp:Transcript_19868/g.37898  ORF Transcript_19868/g.37898 Transcript_19868/m.37898 type:complete len:690 (-) Transcript_19868:134-2203(-)